MYVDKFCTEKLTELLNIQISNIIINNLFYNHTLPNMLIINAWNEWNEQAILEPNNISGYDNLQTFFNVRKYLSEDLICKKFNDDYIIVDKNKYLTDIQINSLLNICIQNNADIISPLIIDEKNNIIYFGGENINDNICLNTKNGNINTSHYNYTTIETNCYYNKCYIIHKDYVNTNINNLKICCTPFVNIVITNNILMNDIIHKSTCNNQFDPIHCSTYLNDTNINKFYTKKKSILFIDIEYNSFNSGGVIYSFNILMILKDLYDVYFHPNTNKYNPFYEELQKRGIKIFITKDIMNLPELKSAYFDIIIISREFNSYYIERLKKIFINSTYINLTHDIVFLRDKNKLQQEEISNLKLYDKCIMISKEELSILNNNGISQDKLIYIPLIQKSLICTYNSHNTKDIYFIGSSHYPNIEGLMLFLQYFYKILNNLPSIKLHIIGDCCNSINDNHPNIIKHGFMKNIDFIIDNCRLMIVPLISGAGMKCKIIETMNKGIPVISTKKGLESIDLCNNIDVFQLDFEDTNYVNKFINIYNDYELLNIISKKSKESFAKNYDLDFFKKTINTEIFENIKPNIKCIPTFNLIIIFQIYNVDYDLLQKTINILTNINLNIQMYIINNNINNSYTNFNCSSNCKIIYVSGDNSFGEWSGFNVVLSKYKDTFNDKSLYLFVNETLFKNYPLTIIDIYNTNLINKLFVDSLKNEFICGNIDTFDMKFNVCGYSIDKWIRGNFFILNYKSLCKLNFNLICYDYTKITKDNLHIYLSEYIIEKISIWLDSHIRYRNHSKIDKFTKIINEYMISAKIGNLVKL